MKRAATALLLAPLALLVALRAPQPVFAGALLILNFIAQRELLDLGEACELRPHRRLALLGGLWLVLLLSHLAGDWALALHAAWPGGRLLLYLAPLFDPFAAMMLAMAAVLAAALLRGGRLPQIAADSGFTLLALFYPALFLGLLGQIRANAGVWWVLFLLLVVWLGDVAALYAGKAWGRRRLAERISPAKSWEGALASLAGALATGGLLAHFAPAVTLALARLHLLNFAFARPFPLAPMLLLALAVNLAAQVGDLAESALKRGAGVKDSGALLPGHGGLLDRIDAMLLAIPVLWYYLYLRS